MSTTVPARDGAFISYARADGEVAARQIHARLRSEAPDIPAWLDRLEIEGGVGWWTQIERELDRAEFLILVMTPAAMRSENTRAEWRSARQRGVCVYPIKAAAEAELDYDSLPNWMRKAHFYNPALEWDKLVAHLRRGCRATRVPFMAPPLPVTVVGREREIGAAIDFIFQRAAAGTGSVTTLRGPGGFGKTTIATAVAHDERIVDAFDDGILWVTLGQHPKLLNQFAKLYAALTGTRPGFVDVDDASRELAIVLEHKNCLIVIDDAWSAAHLRPLLHGAPGCARLITSRSLDVVSGHSRIDIDRMTPGDAIRLLYASAGLDQDDETSLRPLVARLGEWPLAIKLAGLAMRRRIVRGDTLENALRYLSRALDKRGITAFDAEHAADRADAVAHTVDASLELLPPQTQQRCVELAVFQEAQAIPISAVSALWTVDELDAEDLARTLDDLGLVEFDLGRGTLRVHGVLREFFASRVRDLPAVHARILDAWHDHHALPDAYAWRSLAFHLRGARRTRELRQRLLDFRWLENKLRATDIHLLMDDFDVVTADPALDLLRDALKLSGPSLGADPRQLGPQLIARLKTWTEPELVSLLEDAHKLTQVPWLDQLHPTLDAPGGMLVSTLVGHSGAVLALASDSTHATIVSGSSDGTIRDWHARDGQARHVLGRTPLGVRAVALSADGRIALAGGADGLIAIWDLERGQRIGRFSREAGRAITGVAISADATVAVSASRDRALRVWDVTAQSLIRVLTGHDDEVTSVAVSIDGRRAVSGAADATLRVWNVPDGTLERTLVGHLAGVNAVAMSGDGRYALSASSDCTVRFWALETGECLHTLLGHGSSVTAVALAARTGKALAGASDGTLNVWDLTTGATLANVQGHSDEITAITVDPEGLAAASASVDRTIKLWRPAERGLELPFDAHRGAVRSIVFSQNGGLCASGGEDGHIKIREVASGRVVRDIDASGGLVRSLAFSLDSALVLSASYEAGPWLWTVESGDGVWIPAKPAAPIDNYMLSPSARYLITSCSDRFIYWWDVPSGALVDRYGTRRLFDHLIEPAPKRRRVADADYWADRYLDGEALYEVAAVQTSRDGAWVALSAVRRERGAVRDQPRSRPRIDRGPKAACVAVVNLATREVWSVDVAQAEGVSAFAVDDGGSRLLCARADRAIEVWDRNTSAPARILRGHTDQINAVTLFDDGARAVSCGRDRSIRVWDLESGHELTAFTVDAAVRTVAVGPDLVIAAGDVAGRVHLFRLVGL